jgi:acyl transferase domain-containing protein
MSTSEDHPALEPIAIVGMAMRFPGGSNSSDKFWDLISTGRSAHSPIPKDRFNVDGYYHPDSARAGAVSAYPFMHVYRVLSSLDERQEWLFPF